MASVDGSPGGPIEEAVRRAEQRGRRRKEMPEIYRGTTYLVLLPSVPERRHPGMVDGGIFNSRARDREFSEVTGILPSGAVDQKQRGRYMRALQQLDNARITDPAI